MRYYCVRKAFAHLVGSKGMHYGSYRLPVYVPHAQELAVLAEANF